MYILDPHLFPPLLPMAFNTVFFYILPIINIYFKTEP